MTDDAITYKQVKFIETLAKRLSKEMPKVDDMTKQDAKVLIDEWLGKKDERSMPSIEDNPIEVVKPYEIAKTLSLTGSILTYVKENNEMLRDMANTTAMEH